MTDESKAEQRAKLTYEMAVERARGTAKHFTPGYGTTELKPDEKLAVFMDQGDKQWSLDEIHQLYRDGLTREQIGLKMFPKREQLYKTGNIEPRAWIKAANDLARRAAIREAGTLEAVAPPEESY